MIQDLRITHRRMANLFAILLPAIFVTGLVARNAPIPQTRQVNLDSGAGFRLLVGRESVVVRADKVRALVQMTAPGEISAPDVFVYWSPVAAGGTVPAEARLLGSFFAGATFTYNLRAHEINEGVLLIYSLGHQKVLGQVPISKLP